MSENSAYVDENIVKKINLNCAKKIVYTSFLWENGDTSFWCNELEWTRGGDMSGPILWILLKNCVKIEWYRGLYISSWQPTFWDRKI